MLDCPNILRQLRVTLSAEYVRVYEALKYKLYTVLIPFLVLTVLIPKRGNLFCILGIEVDSHLTIVRGFNMICLSLVTQN